MSIFQKIAIITGVGMLVLAAVMTWIAYERGGSVAIPLPIVNQEIIYTVPGPPAGTGQTAEDEALRESRPVDLQREVEPQTLSLQPEPVAESWRPPEVPIPVTDAEPELYVLNGYQGDFEAIGTFALIRLPRLSPGSHVSVSLWIPRGEGTSGISLNYRDLRVNETGVFEALLPREVRDTRTGELLDLSQRRYRFHVASDESRFANCSSRHAVMVEGRPQFIFTAAHRVFCGHDDGVPSL